MEPFILLVYVYTLIATMVLVIASVGLFREVGRCMWADKDMRRKGILTLWALAAAVSIVPSVLWPIGFLEDWPGRDLRRMPWFEWFNEVWESCFYGVLSE